MGAIRGVPAYAKRMSRQAIENRILKEGSVDFQPNKIPAQPGKGPVSLSSRAALFLSAVLALAVLILYYPVNGHPFINYDDPLYVTENVHVQNGLGWETVRWAFTTSYEGNWHPLTWLSHALDYRIFQLNPSGHHDNNVLLHGLNALVLFWVLQKATGSIGRSFMVAAMFALHPVNVETVAWIAERKSLLSMLFFLLALGAYRWYTREVRIGRYVVVAFLYALGLMAKPQVITFPCVLLLWDYWPLRRMFGEAYQSSSSKAPADGVTPTVSFSWLVMEKVPLLALSAASAIITIKGQATGMISYPSRFLSLENAVVCYARYIRNAFWPTRLALMYPHPVAPLRRLQVGIALLILLVVTLLVAAGWRRRYLTVGWLWFLGTLVPMIGFIQVGYQAMADRYAYLSFLGLFIMICWGVAGQAERWHLPAALLPAVSIAVLVAMAVQARRQIDYWRSSETLWSHTLQVTGSNWVAEDNLGGLALEKGNVEAAMPHFFRAAAINPSDPTSNLNIGFYWYQRGNLSAAFEQYKKVLSLKSSARLKANAINDMGLVYRDLGDYAHAQECFEAAKDLRSRYSP